MPTTLRFNGQRGHLVTFERFTVVELPVARTALQRSLGAIGRSGSLATELRSARCFRSSLKLSRGATP
jgi:hypothetical protein